jgi:hypothetical protein
MKHRPATSRAQLPRTWHLRRRRGPRRRRGALRRGLLRKRGQRVRIEAERCRLGLFFFCEWVEELGSHVERTSSSPPAHVHPAVGESRVASQHCRQLHDSSVLLLRFAEG